MTLAVNVNALSKPWKVYRFVRMFMARVLTQSPSTNRTTETMATIKLPLAALWKSVLLGIQWKHIRLTNKSLPKEPRLCVDAKIQSIT